MSLAKIKQILSSGISPKTAMAAIASLDPRLRSFMTAAAAAGYTAESMMEFLQDQSTSEMDRSRRRMTMERAQSGRARPEEMAEAEKIRGEGAIRRGVRNVAGLGAGIAATLADEGQQDMEQPAQQQEQPQGNYLQRALQGVQYFDLPDETRNSLGPFAQRLTRMEKDGEPWESPNVQKLVKAIQSRAGVRNIEAARFKRGYGQQEQPQRQTVQNSADQLVMQGLQQVLDVFGRM